MSSESKISIAARIASRRFARSLAAFYATLFGMTGVHLPFFTVWLKAIGIDATWIGIITAVPPVTRFTVLPLLTAAAERRQMLRGAIMLTGFATALGFFVIGSQHQPLLVLLVYALTCCVWTPMVPLTDAYALRGVARYGLNYGPLRLWGSIAFVVCALASGLLLGYVAEVHLIWIITAMTVVGAMLALTLRPLDRPPAAAAPTAGAWKLLRDPGFLAIIVSSALIQSSHSAYYIFASIAWRQAGFSGLTIAGLWVIGVLAEIVLFALSPRFTLPSATLVVIAAASAVARWTITAQDPPLAILAVIQLAHGLTFGLTQVGIMGMMVHHVPPHVMARGQGYLTACGGIVASTTSILSGMVYARYGLGVYDMMAAMGAAGGLVMWLSRKRFTHHPQSAASGG
ncbi:MFS transporter [Bradyrhizobium sp. ISRA443]|uniref:MFS transporter n=1 Tax=unclassified Bradyrhizobium TaxID=2631580 RepID=UPI0024798824|nr:MULTISPECIES: MFS transporter [unclassified Bradyrhizobium]WGR97345.1 MFS transporter [Bradyrhizobium sp. ISRA436]WGS04234.1 MFS transporter [Bradyrhizobium sp. ISRA437]WGS11117.1 MFS transporter [Bradyrhizobium sp. ISRA443]